MGYLDGLMKGALSNVQTNAKKYYATYKDSFDLLSVATHEFEIIVDNVLSKSSENKNSFMVDPKLIAQVIIELEKKNAIINEPTNDFIS